MSIITSLLDIDFYKLTMAQVALGHFSFVDVVYRFTNRTTHVALPVFIREEELREELEAVRDLGFGMFGGEVSQYLLNHPDIKGIFKDWFVNNLWRLKLPPVSVEQREKTFVIETRGKWHEAIFWETIILAVVNELYYRSLARQIGVAPHEITREGRRRLYDKIAVLQKHPEIKFIEFGTRRRFSGMWQWFVTETLKKKLPDQLLGTSNVLLAKELGISPIGTLAHEMDMVFSGICHGSDDQIRASHQEMLEVWWNEYREKLSIALTDTYGSDFFFRDFTAEQARKWRGLRQDSGDPIVFGEKAIAFYQSHGVNLRTKTLVFSDGLDVDAMIKIADRFAGRIQTVFGWGTNLTNDLGFPPISIVVKAVEANGHGTVKLSDNLAKATGAPTDIERFKRIFGYTNTIRQTPFY